jgi:hypothetical protein
LPIEDKVLGNQNRYGFLLSFEYPIAFLCTLPSLYYYYYLGNKGKRKKEKGKEGRDLDTKNIISCIFLGGVKFNFSSRKMGCSLHKAHSISDHIWIRFSYKEYKQLCV